MTDNVTDSRALLIKEVAYRASYRGTLELDMVCRPLVPQLDSLSDEELAAVRDLLLNKEGDLMQWLVEGGDVPEEWRLSVALVRHFFVESRKAS